MTSTGRHSVDLVVSSACSACTMRGSSIDPVPSDVRHSSFAMVRAIPWLQHARQRGLSAKFWCSGQ